MTVPGPSALLKATADDDLAGPDAVSLGGNTDFEWSGYDEV